MIQFLAVALLFFAALHSYNNWRIQPHSLYLSGALIFITYYFVLHYLFIYGSSVFWLAVLFGHGTPLAYLIGPLFFFYVRGVLRDEHRLSRRDLWHFLPAILDLLVRVPYYFKPWSFKIWMAGELVKDIRNMHDFVDVFFPPSYFSFPARLVSMIGYTVYCLWMVWHFRQHYTTRSKVPIQFAKVPIRFLNYLLGVSLLSEGSILFLLLMFLSDKSMAAVQVIQNPLLLISFLGIVSIPVIIQLHPEVLYGIPRWRSSSRFSKTGMPANTRASSKYILAHNNFQEPEMEESSADILTKFQALAERIRQTLENKQLYLQPDFSMEDLAREMDVPKHHLHYCFKHILKTRFTRLRADYRVRYAQHLIDAGETRSKTLEAIGQESGFSNRISFNNAFREVAGLSPTDYLRKAQKNE